MHFFIDKLDRDSVVLSREDSEHLIKSLRKKIGSEVVVVPLDSEQYCVGEISKIEKKGVEIEVLKRKNKPSSLRVRQVLFQSVLKRAKMEMVLQKATELGVDMIVPFYSKYTVPPNGTLNRNRWEKIVREASMQSRRFTIPIIGKEFEIQDLSGLQGKSLCLAEKNSEGTLKEGCVGLVDESQINIFIGPEGGFAMNEIEFFKSEGVYCASFGTTILRAETAAISVLGAVRLMLL
jgi:16S rRNA (uracil1498-N3)-methyltransferase